jgi:hypothetical protein
MDLMKTGANGMEKWRRIYIRHYDRLVAAFGREPLK